MNLWDKITGKKPEEEPQSPKPTPAENSQRNPTREERQQAETEAKKAEVYADRKAQDRPGPAASVVPEPFPKGQLKTPGDKDGTKQKAEREAARLEKTHDPGPQKVPDIRGGFKVVNNRVRQPQTKQEPTPPPPPKPPIKSFKELHPDDDKTPKR